MNETALLVNTALASGTTLALAALGLLINERAGVLNLGAEGMMLVAAVAGFAVALFTGSDLLAFGAAALAGAALAAVFGVLVIWLNTNQYATGLAISLFGYGFSAFVGVGLVGQSLGEQALHAVGVRVVHLRRCDGQLVSPDDSLVLKDGDTLVLSGRPPALALAEEKLLRERAGRGRAKPVGSA